MHVGWQGGASVQECIAANWNVSFMYVLLAVNLLQRVSYKVWYCIQFRVLHKVRLKNVSTGTTASVKWCCCRECSLLRLCFAWTANHTAEEVRNCARQIHERQRKILLEIALLTLWSTICDYTYKLSVKQEPSVHFTFRKISDIFLWKTGFFNRRLMFFFCEVGN
jgi:hypothetical protein